LLEWIYTGECDLPKDVFQLIDILNIADEYMLQDLQSVCEEEIIMNLDQDNVV